MNTLIENLKTLLSIPSTTGNEGKIADWVYSQLQEHSPTRIENNIICTLRDGDPAVALVGHLDTVPPIDEGQLEPRIEGGYMYGRGAADMKGGLSVMLQLAKETPHSKSKLGVKLVFYSAEEGPLPNGITHLLDGGHLEGTDLAFVLEATNMVPEAGCLSRLLARVEFGGKVVHAAMPWLGKNAIYAALPALQRVARSRSRSGKIGRMAFREALSVTRIETHQQTNSVPGFCRAWVDYRYSPKKNEEDAKKMISRLLTGGSIRLEDSSPGCAITFTPLIKKLLRGFPAPRITPGWTDIAQLNNAGIPAINLGPGDMKSAHAADERISLSDIQNGLRGYLQILSR